MSLTNCLQKAKGVIRADDKAAIIDRARALRGEGKSADDAARQAVDEQLAAVRALLDGQPAAADSRKPTESDKAFAKRVVDSRESPTELPERHADYFITGGATRLDVAALDSSKNEGENAQGLANGPKRMAAAARGELAKREPITVMPSQSANGRYDVVDGNGTLLTARQYGWKQIPVRVVSRQEGKYLIADDRATDSAKRREHPAMQDLAAESRGTLAGMYDRAEAAKPGFDTMLETIAEAVDGFAHTTKLKGVSRAVAKSNKDYDGDPARVKDLVRATLVVRTVDDAHAAIADIRKRFKVREDMGSRNLFDESVDPVDGYRDAKFNVELAGGVIAEIQVNTPEMEAAKDKAHDLYVERETLERSIRAADRKATAQEKARIDNLNAQMRAIYAPAWARAMSARKASTSMGLEPLRRAEAGSNERGGSVSQAAQYVSPTLPSDTGTPSTLSSSTPGSTDAGKDAMPASLPAQGKKRNAHSANTIYTEDAAEKARALLRRKLGGQLNSGIDPEVMQAGITLAGYHIEKGARSFAAYAKAMLEDLGDAVRPYLKSWYMGVKYDPRAAAWEGMDDPAAMEAVDLDALADGDGQQDELDAEMRSYDDAAQTRALAAVHAVVSNRPDKNGKYTAPDGLKFNAAVAKARQAGIKVSSQTPGTSGTVVWSFEKDDGSRYAAYLERSGKGTWLSVPKRQGTPSTTADDRSPETGPEVVQSPAIDDNQVKGNPDDAHAAQALDLAGRKPLGRAPAEPGEDAQAGGSLGRGADRGGRGYIARSGDAARTGDRPAGGVGDGAGALPVPAGGSGRKPRASKPRLPRAPRRDAIPGLFDDAGGEGTASVDPAPNSGLTAPPQFQAEDFTITDDLALGDGGQKAKYRGNVEAIRLLRELEENARLATPDEQRTLARYVGWGGLSQAFDASHKDWGREHAELKALLTPEEYAAAEESTQYAHFTSREVIGGIYEALARLGFTGGKIVEPGAGVGSFIGLMPAGLRTASRFTGIERELISSGIARQLYPRQNIQQADFTEFVGNDGYFDAAIGNPPFARTSLTDKSGRKHLSGMSVHNYFFAKAVDMLREGGILAQVVSNSFLDAQRDNVRRYIADRTEFLGAIRLPNNAFAKTAGTEVTTDIVFLKKLPESQWSSRVHKENRDQWLDIEMVDDPKGGEAIPVNAYFAAHPEMMLGSLGRYGTMYGPDQPALVARPGQDTPALMRAAIARLPQNVYSASAVAATKRLDDQLIVALADKTVQEGGHYINDGKLFMRLRDEAGEERAVQVTPETAWTAKTKLGQTGYDRIQGMTQIRATLRALLAAELSGDKAMVGLRKTLNEQYDAFTKEHGLINESANTRVFDDDPDFPLIASLEHGFTPGMSAAVAKKHGIAAFKATAKKAPIFAARVVSHRQSPTRAASPADALNISMAERGRIDGAYIGSLIGKDGNAVLQELAEGDKPLLFMDPASGEYALRDAYLSGNVRAKLEQAKQAGMYGNVRALEEVQPQDVGAHEVSVRVGSPWVPLQVYEDFAAYLFGEGTKARINYIKTNSSYSSAISGGSDVAKTNTWGTKDYSGPELLTSILNNRDIKVTYRDENKNLRTDVPATEAANLKATDIKQAFADWAFKDGERSELLTKTYNEANNNYVTREFDGSYMNFPGKVPDEVIKFRRHQRNAIARIVQDRTALLDHVVGSGKTFTIVAAAMELKRTGLANKPMVIVPNHLVKQWAKDFYELYPAARILTATKKDFEKHNRRKLLAKIATGDWDAVIIAHSSFGFIRPAPEFEAKFNQRQVASIVETIRAVEEQEGDDSAKKRTVKQLAALKERLENRIDALRQKPIDALLDFQQIGVDQLFVDEAHLFKNLMFTTKMQNVRGLGQAKGSQRAYDLFIKAHQTYDQNGRGQGVVFATGTPISNSLAEMYHMMRYLMPDAMHNAGFESFDAWANTFAVAETEFRKKTGGDGFKAVTSMSRFVNTPDLLKFFDQVADTVTMDDIKAAYREENPGREFPLPKLATGRRQPVSIEKSAAQTAYMHSLVARAKAIEGKRTNEKGMDNALKIMGDGRKVSMDIRLVDFNITTREKGGRIDRAADEIISRYQKYAHVKGTQLVFSDLGTPIKHAKKEMKEWEALQERIDKGSDPQTVTAANLGSEAAMELVDDAEDAQGELDAMGPDWLDAVKAALRGFSVYDDLKAALIERGIPEHQIAFIHDYNTDDQKASLFRKVNAGDIRVLMGSTPKLGAGTNVQERLVAMHQLDVPWRPSDVEQREGRIIRQGNRLAQEIADFEVEILAYVTKDTLDDEMWRTQERKLRIINQLRSRHIGREIDNAFEDMEMSASEMQAAATGNMDFLKEIQLRTDLKKLENAKRSHDAQRGDLETRRKRSADAIRALPAKIAAAQAMAKVGAAYEAERDEHTKRFKVTIDGVAYTDAKEAGDKLRAIVDAKVYRKVGTKIDITEEQYQALPEGERDAAAAVEEGQQALTAWKSRAAPLDVEFNGQRYTARTELGEAFAEVRGDVNPLMWKLDGKTYTRRVHLAAALGKRVADAIADEQLKQLGTIGGFDVAIEGQGEQRDRRWAEVTISGAGQTLSTTFASSADAAVSDIHTATKATRAIEAALGMASGLDVRARFLEMDLARAKKTQAELEKAGTIGDWPGEAKLAAARAAHRDVLQRLAAPTKSGEQIEQEAMDAWQKETGAITPMFTVDSKTANPDTAGYAPDPNPQHHHIARKWQDAIVAEGNPAFVLTAVTPPGSRSDLRSAAAVARGVAGHGVVFVRQPNGRVFNGSVTTGKNAAYVLIDVDSTQPVMAVLGHEILHRLRAQHPDLYQKLHDRLAGLLRNESNYQARILKSYAESRLKPLEAGKMREELIADIFGDEWSDPEFWRELARGEPKGFKAIVDAVAKFLDDLIARITRLRPFGTEQYLSDLTAARQAVLDATREFTRMESDWTADAGEIKFSAADLHTSATDAAQAHFAGTLTNWDKTIGTPYNLAQRKPQFKRVFDALNTFIKDVSLYANEAADKASTLLPALNRVRDVLKKPVSAKDSDAIAKPIFEGTLMWMRGPDGKPVRVADRRAETEGMETADKAQQMLKAGTIDPKVLRMWQGLPLEQYERNVASRYDREMVGTGGIVWTDAELKSMFDLNKAQIGLYREFRAATDKSLDDLMISAMLRVGGRHTADLTDQAMDMPLDEAAEMLRDRMFERAQETKALRDELNAAGNQMIDLADKANSLKDRGYAPLMRFGDRTASVYEDGELVYFGMYENGLERVRALPKLREMFPGAKVELGTVSKEEFKMFAGVTPETLELFGGILGDKIGFDTTNPVYQEFIRKAKANTSGIKRLLHRKGTAGYSEQPSRVLASFIYSNARQVSGNLHTKTIADAIKAISQKDGELKDYAVKLDEYVRNPGEEAQQIRALLFTNFIGGSIASAAVNLTQPLQVTLPYLTKHDLKAPAHMASALTVMWKKGTGDADLDAALAKAEEEGVISPQEVHHLLAQARGAAVLRSGEGAGKAGAAVHNAMSRLMVLWGAPFSLAEQFNRRLTFIAAYKTAQANGMPDPAAFAEQAVDETQYIYTKVNNPRWARGWAGAPLMTFKKYSISWVEGMVRLARSGPEGKRAALLMLALLVLMSGLEGLPFREDLEDMIDGFAQRVLERDFSAKDWRRKLLREVFSDAWADFAERGVSGIPGVPVDVSGRMGLHNLIPGTGMLLKKDSYGRDIAEVGGAAGGLLKQYGEAAALAAEGDIKGAATKASPAAVQNVVKMTDMLKTGTYRDARGNVVKQTTPAEAVGKGGGFQPKSVAQTQDAAFTQQRRIVYVKQIESEIVGDMASAIVLKDDAAFKEANGRLAQWNRSNKESPIRITPEQVRSRVRNMTTEKIERVVKSAPKELRGSVASEVRQ